MQKNEDDVLKWNGVPVLTTKMLAERLGVFEGNIHTNFAYNKDKYIENQDHFIVQGDDLKVLKRTLSKNNWGSDMISKNTKGVYLWTEGGAYNHAKSAETELAWDAFLYLKKNYFKQREALKAIGEAFLPNNPLFQHTKREIQVSNSKKANEKNFTEGGVESVKAYSIKTCVLHCGKTPAQLKAIAKKMGMMAKQMTSGKEVLRHLKPAIAASMSLTDDMCNHGGKLEEIAPLSVSVQPVFEKMIELGMLKKAS